MPLFSTLQTGASGLRAASAATNAASHNVANASTPGFHRRRVVLETAPPIQLGGRTIGLGVTDRGHLRAGSELVSAQRVTQAGVTGSASAQARALSMAERFLGNEGTGNLSGALDGFFDALTSATADPADLALRRGITSAATDVASVFSGASSRMAEAIQGIDQESGSIVQRVTDKLSEVARLDEALVADTSRLASGDLLDRRDQLIYEVSELMGVRMREAEDGSTELYLGGHLVSADGKARSIKFESDVTTGQVRVLVEAGGGFVDVSDDVGGELGGLLGARDTVSGYVDDLDAITVAFADAINTQHRAGFDRDGNPGEDLFVYDANDPAGTLVFAEDIVADPDRLALAGASPVRAGDGDNLDALSSIEDDLLVGASWSVGTALSELGARVGSDTSHSAAISSQQDSISEDLEDLHQSLVGVDLDEEAAKLVEHQAAYQAAAKIVQVTDRLLGTLLELV